MSEVGSNNKRLAKNTMFMYIRMLVILSISLYTSRVILATLGVSDFGLYNVVGGVVSMFAFLNAALSTGTQRFLNYELGQNNQERLRKVFSTSLSQHLMLVGIVLLFAETIGLWFVLNKLNIELGREFAAMCVYQTSIAILCIQIIQLPFMSAIIAHEKLGMYAYMGILEASLRLGIVFVLMIGDLDRLILYGFLMLCSQIIISSCYIFYSHKTFTEVLFTLGIDKQLFKDMFKFTGWNLFGNFCTISNSQGVNILMNLFFGTVVNAARGVAFQANNMISQFVNNFQVAVKPQVVKYYANGDIVGMTNLVQNTAKFSAFLVMLIAVPLMVEIKPVLHLWLGEYPDFTPWFVILIFTRSIFYSMVSATLQMVHATGKVKAVSLCSGLAYFMVLPIGYVMFKAGMSPYSVFVVNIFACIADQLIELYWMKHYIDFSIMRFLRDVYLRVIPILIINVAITIILHNLLSDLNEYIEMVVVGAISVILSASVIYLLGLTPSMRQTLKKQVSKFIRK